ncbi:S41 family peptidase [Streptomyces sp. NBC_00572]|uniref:S41 family peptidase n=1 Tax=Streptomyces sp. NBC_00572 TaxID=2903664 RepID=UPI00224C90FE|nr:S41 family peptidase [Streptomyces sp. NBC_00572]MCX4982407.1 S41 family peptidase [Streptomyces sp. NBC_00572]
MRHKRLGGAMAVTAVMATAMAAGTVGPATATGRTTGPTGPVDGVWRVDGYGTVLSIADGHLREYQTTAISCVPGEEAVRTAPGTYRTEDGTLLTVRPQGTLHIAGSTGDRVLRRLAALPSTCDRTLPDDPLTAFDVFWQTFEENYPFFADKGIDWQAVRDTYRPKVHEDTTKEELLALLDDMVAPLYDAHVSVSDGDRRSLPHFRPGTTSRPDLLDSRAKEHIVRRDLGGTEPQEFGNGRISYADLPDGQGYLRISGFAGYDRGDRTYAGQLAVLDRALDTVLTRERTASLQGLIIDLRVNGGGDDALGLHLAGRLTDTPYVAYRKRTRDTPPQAVRVEPARHTPRYTGPVAVLTADTTFSAGETFTQALIDRPGRTVRVGAPTQGVFSDVLERSLPNGMAFLLPNEEFLTRTGRTFDITGIPPHLPAPVFTEEEFRQNRDSAFDTAAAALKR